MPLYEREQGGGYVLTLLQCGGKTVQKTLEYLGRDPDTKRLKRALRYWGVKQKASKSRGGEDE